MKVLVIPDVHLKPRIFEAASRLMRERTAEKAVCLMDLPDDWGCGFDLDLYRSTFDAAIRFAKDFPETLWCYGNHDVSYLWGQPESGYSRPAAGLVRQKLGELQRALPTDGQLTFLHRIGGVLFLHGGLTEVFVEDYVPAKIRLEKDPDRMIEAINAMGCEELWRDVSPLWHRPQYSRVKMYEGSGLLQVVGHTPVETIERDGNVISCDVFSTDRSGRPVGTREFLLIDTATGEFCGVK